jgi:hypothetical protein
LQQLFFQNIPPRHFFCHHSFEEQSQLQSVNTTIGGALIGEPKTTFFQPFVPQCKTVTVPVQALKKVATPVDEYEERPGQGVGIHTGADEATQSIKGFSHVAGTAIKIDAGGGSKSQHGLATLGAKSIYNLAKCKGVKAPIHLDRDSVIQVDANATAGGFGGRNKPDKLGALRIATETPAPGIKSLAVNILLFAKRSGTHIAAGVFFNDRMPILSSIFSAHGVSSSLSCKEDDNLCRYLQRRWFGYTLTI